MPVEEWKRVDLLFEQMKPDIVMVLTEQSAERVGEGVYIHLEPLAPVVIALSYVEKRASISADSDLSGLLGPGFTELTNQAERLLSEGQVIEALVFSIHKSCAILKGARWRGENGCPG